MSFRNADMDAAIQVAETELDPDKRAGPGGDADDLLHRTAVLRCSFVPNPMCCRNG